MRKKSQSYFVFIILFYFFVFYNYLYSKIPVIGYADELIALMAIPLWVIRLLKKRSILLGQYGQYKNWIILFLAMGLAGSLVFQYQPFLKIAAPDFLLCTKFWLCIYVGQCLFRNLPLKEYAKNIHYHIRLVACFYVLLIVLDWMFDLFVPDIRYGIRSTHLFYSHPTAFAMSCALLIVILVSIRNYTKGCTKTLICLLILLCSTMRSKAWGGAIMFVLIYYFAFFRKKKISLRTVLLFLPLVIVIGWDQIEYYFFSSIRYDSARYQLLIKSIEVASDHFPLGSGFGTFATYYSTVTYSPLYAIYGLNNVNGLRPSNPNFVSDTFWPMVIAQTGWIGLIAMLLAIWFLFKKIQKLRRYSNAYYASGLCIVTYLLVTSMAESAFVNPLSIPLALWLGVLFSKYKVHTEENKNVYSIRK